MRETVKLGLRLMLFALAAGLLLACVNALTEEPIARNENMKINASRIAVLGDYQFEALETDLEGYEAITGVYSAMDDSGETVGYVYELSVLGYAGNISLSVGLKDGEVAAVNISSHLETRGLGTSQEEPFLEGFVGLPEEPSAALNVDGMTGATVSSNAVSSAVSQALAHASNVLGGGVDAVTGATDDSGAYETYEPETDAVTGATDDSGAYETYEPETDAVTGATDDSGAYETSEPETDAVTGATVEEATA